MDYFQNHNQKFVFPFWK